jgi:hypothetical protein
MLNLIDEHTREKTRAGLSFSTVDHLRWDLKQIFDMAIAEGHIVRNPALLLFTPGDEPEGGATLPCRSRSTGAAGGKTCDYGRDASWRNIRFDVGPSHGDLC